jgi:hypothetical protein
MHRGAAKRGKLGQAVEQSGDRHQARVSLKQMFSVIVSTSAKR